jgi:hypothetical protein
MFPYAVLILLFYIELIHSLQQNRSSLPHPKASRLATLSNIFPRQPVDPSTTPNNATNPCPKWKSSCGESGCYRKDRYLFAQILVG